jgi:hypothetical protein
MRMPATTAIPTMQQQFGFEVQEGKDRGGEAREVAQCERGHE